MVSELNILAVNRQRNSKFKFMSRGSNDSERRLVLLAEYDKHSPSDAIRNAVS